MASGAVDGVQIPSTFTNLNTFYNSTGLLEGHIFNQGLEQPDVLRALIIKYPKYYLTQLIDKIGGSGEIDNDTISWNIMGRTRKGAAITALSNGTTTTATATLDTAYDAATGNLGYFLVGDTVRVSESGIIGRVTAVSNSGGTVQTIDVARYDGAAWATTTILNTWHIGHVGSMYGEGSTGAGGYRSYFPENDYNVTTKLRRDFKITRDAMKSKKWVDAPGGKNWWYAQEDFEQREFMRDIEATVLLGKRFKSTSLQGANLSRGIIESAETSGKTVTFSSSVGVQEADWAYLAQQLSDEQGSDNLIALCGTQILADTMHSLGDRYRTYPDMLPTALKETGIDFTSYKFLGKTIHFAKYEMFSDTSIFPSVSASSTIKDSRNLALVLDFSPTDNGTNIQLKYRNGSKLIQKMIPGMASPGLEAANKFDGIEGALLSEVTPVVYLPNRLGLVYSNS
jgi:hypothetical protein